MPFLATALPLVVKAPLAFALALCMALVFLAGPALAAIAFERKSLGWKVAAGLGTIPWLLGLALLVFHATKQFFPTAGERALTESAGYFLMEIVAGIGVMGVFAASVAVATLAFLRRTRGWRIAGIVGGILCVGMLIPFFWAAMSGALKSRGPLTAAADLAEPTALLTGQGTPFTFRVPEGWSCRRGGGTDSTIILAQGKNLYLKVIGEDASYGDTTALLEFFKRQIAPMTSRADWGPLETETVDGREWTSCTVRVVMANAPIELLYRVHFHAGPAGGYTFLLWTAPNLFDRYLPQMDKIFRTFRFPADAPRPITIPALPAPAPTP